MAGSDRVIGFDMGPACYRGGGPLAVTDADVMLGRTQSAPFPRVFGPDGDQSLGAELVRDRFTALAREIRERTGASGSGAGGGFPGAPALQTHMTNSRLTGPEVLERRPPVQLDECALRTGSGGAGKGHGGDGAVRRIRFHEPMTVSILSQHRRVPPYGTAGGEPGVLVIETPGGGYGPPSTQHPQQAGEETNDLRAF
ncbi:hydantoinase B/oxoprolinase family protein [Streptomyces sp. NPDC050759]|uniref:hydantoinase B/oxoprolinase family protein n=1 Tax=Streptomyces sp. NPDC050759 TaxID=3365635 RepID=UPI0037B3CB49